MSLQENEQTQVKSDGTQITTRSEIPKPDMNRGCQAAIQLQVVVMEPLTDGTWRLICSERDSYNVVLSERNADKLSNAIKTQMGELQNSWKKNSQEIISLHNPLNIEPTE